MGQDDWQRARSDEQIELRVKQILNAAAMVFREEDYEKVTMQKIAARAGFTRSNLYRYFTTKEEIFLSLLVNDTERWVQDLAADLGANLSRRDFINVWISVLRGHTRFLELFPLLSLSLERNSSREVYRNTKIAFGNILSSLEAVIHKALPGLSSDAILNLLRFSQIVAAGAWPMCRRTEMQEEVLKELNIPFLQPVFFPVFEEMMETYLRGLGI